jgi:hypothetical protein
MNNTRVLIGTFFLTVSSLALAAGHENPGHAKGGAVHPGAAASVSEHSGARASAAVGVMPSGPLKGTPVRQVSQETIGGHEARMAHLAERAALTPDERREIRSAGFLELHDQQGSYYCRKVQTSLAGWVSECFRFDARSDSEEIQHRAKEAEPKADPKKDEPQKTPGRVALS